MERREFWMLEGLSDGDLVIGLRELVDRGARTDARVVAHLAEVEVRRLHLLGGRSLFKYCLETLGLSENQAFYRIQAAHLARRFPLVFELLEQRQVHLTSLALLRDHITDDNHAELLREVSGKTKGQILQLLAGRAPRPDVPSRIRRLVPNAKAVAAGPTGALEPLSASSYRLQLNASHALKQKLAFAAQLMTHSNPSGDLAVVVERGLDLLIDHLQKERFGKTSRARQRPVKSDADPPPIAAKPADCAVTNPRRRRTHIPREVLRQLIDRDDPALCNEPGASPKA